jgi:hypothetical protein
MKSKLNGHQRFYLLMAWIGALIAAIGFSRRYFMPLAAGTFQAPAIVHLHGVITLFYRQLWSPPVALRFTAASAWLALHSAL